MRTSVALFLILILAATAFAEPIRPFLGFGANINQTDDHFMQVEDQRYVAMKLPKHDGLSLQFEGGITAGSYSAYLGYRSGSSSYDDSKTYTIEPVWESLKFTKSEITSQHFVLGTRLEPLFSFMPEFLRPVVGLGVTYGTAKKETAWDDTYVATIFPDTTYNTDSFTESVESEDAYGGIMEFGFAVRSTKLPLRAYLTYEVHAYKAEFTNLFRWSPTADQYEIRENGVKVGLIYQFGKIAGE